MITTGQPQRLTDYKWVNSLREKGGKEPTSKSGRRFVQRRYARRLAGETVGDKETQRHFVGSSNR
jgi:hypothetical protein